MSLTDIMSAMDLAVYPQVALVIFLAVFAIVTWRVIQQPRTVERERSMLPLESTAEEPQAPERSGPGAPEVTR